MDTAMIGGYADMQKWTSIFGLVNSSGPPPPVLIPPGGSYIPTLTLVAGISTAKVVQDTDGSYLAKFVGNSKFAGGVIDTSVKLQLTTDGSGSQCQLVISNPIAGNFTLLGQAQITGLPSIVQNPGAVGNTGSGWNGNLTANLSPPGVLFIFETSQINTTYYVDVSWKYEIQS